MLIKKNSSPKIVSYVAAITFSVLGSAVLYGCGGNGDGDAGSGVASPPAFDGNGVVKVLATSDAASSTTPYVISNTNTSEGADPVFDGIGGLSAGASSALLYYYPIQQRNEILDYLFKPNYGQANQILKVEIGGDMNSTLGTENAYNHGSDASTASSTDNINNGYETWLIGEAFKRNPNIKIWGQQWGVPKWVGGVCTDANAAYLSKWVKLVQAQTGAKVATLSAGWNEAACGTQATDHGTVGTSSNGKDTYTDATFPPVLSAVLAKNSLTGIQLVGLDGLPGAQDANTIANLPTSPTNNALYAIGSHYSEVPEFAWTPSKNSIASVAAKKRGLKFWLSEDSVANPVTTGAHLTRQYNYRYLNDGATAIVNWPLMGASYSSYPYMLNPASPRFYGSFAMEPWSGHYSLLDAPFWSMAHTTQFATPGWRYVTSASGRLPGGGSIVTYRSAGTVGTVGTKTTSASPSPEDWSAVIETTDATSAQDITIQVSTGLSAGPVSIVTSSDVTKAYFVPVSSTILPDASGNIKLSVQPNAMVTLSTTSGQAKGAAALNAPPSSEFPASHSDDFESYAAGEDKMKYFQAVNGAFEAATCGSGSGSGRTGMCLQQVVPVVPVLWAPWGTKNLTPITLIGKPNVSDNTVKTDVLLNDSNSTTFGGISGHVQVGNATEFAGYKFIIRGDGTWSLFTGEAADGTGKPLTVLASGRYSVAGTSPSWHTLSLALSGGTFTPLIDGVSPMTDATPAAKVVTVPAGSSAPLVGQSGLVSSFSGVQFDNFSVNYPTKDAH